MKIAVCFAATVQFRVLQFKKAEKTVAANKQRFLRRYVNELLRLFFIRFGEFPSPYQIQPTYHSDPVHDLLIPCEPYKPNQNHH